MRRCETWEGDINAAAARFLNNCPYVVFFFSIYSQRSASSRMMTRANSTKLERRAAVSRGADFHAFFPREETPLATLFVEDGDSSFVVQVATLEVAL